MTAQPPSASVQRQLVLLSKILQNLANEAEFGAKEEYMAKLNAFVHDNKPELVKFYAKITSESDPSDTPVPMPNAAKENALGFLHEHIIANIDKINADLDTHPEGTVTSLFLFFRFQKSDIVFFFFSESKLNSKIL